MSSNKWFVRPYPRLSATVRLICLPYAGGSVSTYLPWATKLPAHVELIGVQLPGRASRIGEPPYSEMSDLVRELAHVFHEIVDKPYVLFGHSLGSRVAYEFAQQCQSFGLPRPKLLIASGSRAPHIPNERASIHDLPEVEFIAKLRELNGTPEEVLSNRELIQFLIPLLRADFRIAEKYQSVPRKLGCPILALAGKEDLEVTELSVESWRELSNGKCEIHWIPGGHFFIEENRPLVLEKVNAALAEIGRITHVA